MKNTLRYLVYIFTLALTPCVIQAQHSYELMFLNHSFDEILELSQKRDSEEAIYWNALITDKLGSPLEAANILQQGLVSYPQQPRLEILLIEIQYKLGQYAQVKPLLEQHLTEAGNFIKYIKILEFNNQYNIAIDSLENRLKSDSSNLELLVHLGDNYFQSDKELSAIQTFEKVLKINPNDIQSISKLANLYIKMQNYDSAISLCKEGLKLDSTSSKMYKTMAIAYNKKSDHKNAEKYFQILNLNGDSSQFVLKNLGISEFFCEEFDDSREHLLQAYKNDKNDFEICYVLGKDYYQSRDPRPGLFYFDKADSLLQADTITLSMIHDEKQLIYMTLKEYNNALMSFEKAYAYNPKPEYLYFMASLYHYRFNDKKKAYELYNAYIAAIPHVETEKDNDPNKPESRSVSLKIVAERNIERLKEELFFEGGL